MTMNTAASRVYKSCEHKNSANPSAHALSLQSLTVRYAGKTEPAVNAVNFDFTSGICAILGPNGAGKSSLFGAIAGLIPYQGNILLNGKPIEQARTAFAAKLGFMPQQQRLLEQMRVEQFLEYFGLLKGMSREDLRHETPRVAEYASATELLPLRIKSLSGGMKQRVLLAQALLNDPKVLLLDEPTAGLDPEERVKFRNRIAELALDRMILLATHIVSDVDSIAHDVIFLRKGNFICRGKVRDVLAQFSDIAETAIIRKEQLRNYIHSESISEIREIHDGRIQITRVRMDQQITRVRTHQQAAAKAEFSANPAAEDVHFEPAPVSLHEVYIKLYAHDHTAAGREGEIGRHAKK